MSRGGELSTERAIILSFATILGTAVPSGTDEISALALSVTVLWRSEAGAPGLIWQQSRRDRALIEVALWGMAIPLHPAFSFEL